MPTLEQISCGVLRNRFLRSLRRIARWAVNKRRRPDKPAINLARNVAIIAKCPAHCVLGRGKIRLSVLTFGSSRGQPDHTER